MPSVMLVNIKRFYSMLMQVTTQFFKTGKIRKFLENLAVEYKFLLISRWKSDCFSKSYIYSERGSFGASFYGKKSISIFFEKLDFLRGGPYPCENFSEKASLNWLKFELKKCLQAHILSALKVLRSRNCSACKG